MTPASPDELRALALEINNLANACNAYQAQLEKAKKDLTAARLLYMDERYKLKPHYSIILNGHDGPYLFLHYTERFAARHPSEWPDFTVHDDPLTQMYLRVRPFTKSLRWSKRQTTIQVVAGTYHINNDRVDEASPLDGDL